MTQIFKKQVSTKTTTVVFGVLIIACVFAFYVSAAWNEPTQTPPQGNVPAPINVGPSNQQKEGGLTVLGGISTNEIHNVAGNYYLTLDYVSVLGGPIGIGPTTTPQYTLDVAGDINTAQIYRVNGTAGGTKSCLANEVLKGINILGGIITAGECLAETGGGDGCIPSMISNPAGSTMNLVEAVSYCRDLTESGFTDWRLPTLEEAVLFVGISTPGYTLTRTFTDEGGILAFHLLTGNLAIYNLTGLSTYVRCVR